MSDAGIRQAAINTGGSFIVQAPAGSGKTELLIQRILALLATVDEPEEILALTFTRKAAGEMRTRVIQALEASAGHEPKEAHAQLTWKLACAARTRSEKRNWRLPQHPARLNIMTIDAFASGLARQMPLAAGFGEMPEIADDAAMLYLEAAERLLRAVRENRWPDSVNAALDALLLHGDHRTSHVLALIADMLACREQWLPLLHRHATDEAMRAELEGNLCRLASDRMAYAAALFPEPLRQQLLPLLRFAANNLTADDPQHAVGILTALDRWPDAAPPSLPAWRSIITLLLKKDGSFYQRISKTQGFPAGKDNKAEKDTFTELLAVLSEIQELAPALDAVRALPEPLALPDEDWAFVRGLFVLLKLAASELDGIIASQGQADFTAVALYAQAALGADGQMTDLLLRMDRRTRHVLIDEFQDTSFSQIDLLLRLAEGWEAGDGRTLFMVGDPMQSIYRFRKAEVGLFLRAVANDFAGLPPTEPLRLSRNFRSSPAIVEWVNRAFSGMLPALQNATIGAVPYSPSESALEMEGNVALHWQEGRDDAAETATIIDLVQNARSASLSVGILARSRAHLHDLMRALHDENIPYRAVEVQPLDERPEVRDLRALTRALLHPLDRESWAALLRAPFCGLSMPDLHALLAGDDRAVADILANPMRLAELSEDGRQRAQHLYAALAPSLAQSGRTCVRKLVESAWLRLAAPSMLATAQISAAGQYLDVLDAQDLGGQIDFVRLDRALADLRAVPDASDDAIGVELLTMHGAKGLEWDVVILPGLGKQPRGDSSQLLAWTDAPLADGEALLLAAKPDPGGNAPMYDLIRDVEKNKREFEVDRLLYVACTRARRHLHLIGHLEQRKDGPTPARASLLARLWQNEDGCYGASVVQLMPSAGNAAELGPWLRASSPPLIKLDVNAPEEEQAIPQFAWAGPEAAPIGNAVHAALQHIGMRGVESFTEADMARLEIEMRRTLVSEGLHGTLLATATERCRNGLRTALASDRGRWLLSGTHSETYCEWALSLYLDGQVTHAIIDRSFVDADGIRWIVDYKTASHEGGDVQDFLGEEEKRYAPQLLRYAGLVKRMEPERAIRLGLYFPMLDAWREINADES